METRSQVLTVDSEAVRQVISLALCALCGSVCVSILNILVFMTEVLPKWLRGAVVNGTSSCTQHQGTITPYHHTIIHAILGVWDLCYIIWKVSRYHSRKTSCSNVLQRFLVKNNLFQFFFESSFFLMTETGIHAVVAGTRTLSDWPQGELRITFPSKSGHGDWGKVVCLIFSTFRVKYFPWRHPSPFHKQIPGDLHPDFSKHIWLLEVGMIFILKLGLQNPWLHFHHR